MTAGTLPPSASKRSALSNAFAGLTAGLSLFAFLFVARRALGPEQFVPLGQLLIVWPISHAIVAFPVQQLRARSDPAAGKVAIALVVVATGVLIPLFWRYGEDFTRSADRRIHIIAMLLPLGALATAWGRGIAAAQRRDGLLATLVAGENLIRLALGIVLWIAGAGPLLFGLALLAGFGLNAMALGDGQRRERAAPRLGSVVEQMVAMTAVGGMGYAALFLAPGSLALDSRTDEVVAALLFAMAAYRAPYQIMQSMVPKLAAEFAHGRWMSTPFLWLAASGPVFALFAAGGAALCGQWFLDLLVGDGDILLRSTHAAAAATTTVATLNVIGSVALVARGQYRSTAAVWILPGLIAAYPIINADQPGPLLAAMELYVAMVYVGELWAWSRLPSLTASRATLLP